jgi:large subunit ribosomal protein L5
MTENKQNPMQEIKVAKLTLNIGTGKNEDMMKKGLILLKKLSPLNPVKTITQKRIPGWGLRPGLTIGCKVTVRKNATELLKRLLVAKENKLKLSCFDTQGNFSFGVPEYIDIEGMEYDPDLKILGLEVAVTLEKPGFRVKKRRIYTNKIGKNHTISKEDAIEFVKNIGVEVE